MVIVNRNGFFNDVMFEELANFAQHQIKQNNFNQVATLNKENTLIADIEDVRIVFNKPEEVQIKCRVSKAVQSKITKSDKINIVLASKAPNKAPVLKYEVTKWYEELGELIEGLNELTEVVVTDNKWLYVKAKRV